MSNNEFLIGAGLGFVIGTVLFPNHNHNRIDTLNLLKTENERLKFQKIEELQEENKKLKSKFEKSPRQDEFLSTASC